MTAAGKPQVLARKASSPLLKCSGECFIILNTTFGECLICSDSKHSSRAKCNVNTFQEKSLADLVLSLQTAWLEDKVLRWILTGIVCEAPRRAKNSYLS